MSPNTIFATGILKKLPVRSRDGGFAFVLAVGGVVRSEAGWHDAAEYISVETEKIPPCLAAANFGDEFRVRGRLLLSSVDYRGIQKNTLSIQASRITLSPKQNAKTSRIAS